MLLAFLALVLHASGLVALLASLVLALMLLGCSGLSLAVVALLVGGLGAGLAVLMILTFVFFLNYYLLSCGLRNLGRHRTNGENCHNEGH